MNLLKEKTVADQLLEALDNDKELKRFSVLKQVSEEGDFESILETDSIQEAAAQVEEIEFKDNAYAFVLDNMSGEAIEKQELIKSLTKDIDDEDEDLFECSLEESHMSDIDVTRQELERLLQDKREALDVMEMRHDPSEREDIEELKDDMRDISDILNDIEDGKLSDIQKRAAKHLGEELIEAVDDSENITDEESHDDEHKCCICGGPLGKYGNNAEPVADGKCCDDCNLDVVIPARLNAAKSNKVIDEAKEIQYDYDDAVDYIESNGISCDPCSYDYADYVCDKLDADADGYDDYDEPYYYQSTLDSIIEDTKEYIKDMEESDLDESLLEKRRKKRKEKAQGWFVNYNAGNVEHNNDFFNHANGSDCEGCGEATGMGEALDVEESDMYRGARLIPSDNLGSWTKEEVIDELKADLDTIYDQGYFDEGDIISIEEVITDDESYFIIDSRSNGKANYELIGGRLYNYEESEKDDLDKEEE